MSAKTGLTGPHDIHYNFYYCDNAVGCFSIGLIQGSDLRSTIVEVCVQSQNVASNNFYSIHFFLLGSDIGASWPSYTENSQ